MINSLKVPLLLFLASTMSLYASEVDQDEKSTATEEVTKKDTLKEVSKVTEHTMRIGHEEVSYKATAGTLALKQSSDDEELASVFYVAYTRNGIENLGNRPLTFVTNGGPGSSAVWLHMGVFGPRRVHLDEQGYASPPYSLVDNVESILDVTDLVFIDPVMTGFSRPAPGQDQKQFLGVEEDVKYLAEFIRLYLSRYKRWESPKFFAGESYGTTRAAAIAQQLHDEEHIYLNGLMLISSVLNFQTQRFHHGNDLPYVTYLPSYTAAAHHHKKLPASLQNRPLPEVLKEAEHFAYGQYNHALMRGDSLPERERKATISQLARYTGLSEEFLDRANMRIHLFRFVKELLRDQKRTVGRFDCRYTGIDSDAAGEVFEYDPSADAIFGAYTAAWNHYLLTELDWESDRRYEILANVFRDWKWKWQGNHGYVSVVESLRSVMTRNPKLKVFVASGYHDLATPYFATRYALDHLGLDISLRGNVTVEDYEGGHMMYAHKPSLIKMKKDLTSFIKNAAK